MTAQDQQSREAFEKAWADRPVYMGGDHQKDLAFTWWFQSARRAQAEQAACALPAPENVREGEPYDNPAFEDLARTMGVWGTAQSALCSQFFLAGRAAAPRPPTAPERKPLTDERIREIDDETHFHESPGWPLRFARAIEAELKKAPAP